MHGPSTETVAMPRVQCAETVRLNPPLASKLRLEHSPSTCSEPPHRPQSPPLRPPWAHKPSDGYGRDLHRHDPRGTCRESAGGGMRAGEVTWLRGRGARRMYRAG